MLHVHCRHGDGDFSKFEFFQHHYNGTDLSRLDVRVVKDYAMLLAVETWRSLSGGTQSAQTEAAGHNEL